MDMEDRSRTSPEQLQLQVASSECGASDVGGSRAYRVYDAKPRLSPTARIRVKPQTRAASGKLQPTGLAVPTPFAKESSRRKTAVSDWQELMDLPLPSEARLRQLFDLTPAEARLARGLARGDALEEVAGELNIKMTTARSQLASIFSKTQTRRQAGLVAILIRLAHLDELGSS
jgi:DNA-binding CsgD family transcriptional regulator